jgi:hypothetical protein
MKKAECQYLTNLAYLGCIICEGPAEMHHPRGDQAIAPRADHMEAIPLCPAHHRTGGHGVALHAGQEAFEAKYGTEAELLEKTKTALATLERMKV